MGANGTPEALQAYYDRGTSPRIFIHHLGLSPDVGAAIASLAEEADVQPGVYVRQLIETNRTVRRRMKALKRN